MQTTSFRNITRGGQTLLHNLRMISQVLNKVLLWTLPFGLIIGFTCSVLITETYARYVGYQWLLAQLYGFFYSAKHKQIFLLENGHAVKVSAEQLLSAPFIQSIIEALSGQIVKSLWVGLTIYLFIVIAVVVWLKKRGDEQSKSKHVKGDRLASADEVKKIIQAKDKQSDLMVGTQKIPLPRNTEMQHFLFHGTTGSGKSTCIKEFLDLIRSRGDRAIIYDKSCSFVEQFYDSKTDHILNPWDERTRDWSLWRECRDKADFESLSAALIPMPLSTQDPFWVNAARTIFAASTYRLQKEKNPKILPLLRYLLTADITNLQSLLKGTEAESLISEKAEKTAISIKSVLATYLRSLCFVKDGDNPFSIRQWIHDDNEKNWLFISSLGDRHESAKPLITAWLDIALNALLSLSINSDRRIWIILDELTSLHILPYLSGALSEARKFGGCFVIGIQSYAQAIKVYGQSGAQEISTLLNTRFMFRIPDPAIAKWSAENLGETTIEEVREGISYGANTLRDGVSVNRSERDKLLVSYSDIMNLNDLTCYLRLPGHYPITKCEIPYVKREARNEPFIRRVFEVNNLRDEVIHLTDKVASLKSTHKLSSIATKKSVRKAKTTSTTHREIEELFNDID